MSREQTNVTEACCVCLVVGKGKGTELCIAALAAR